MTRDEAAAFARGYRDGQVRMRGAAEDAARTVAVLAGEARGERAAGRAEGALAAEHAIRALPVRDPES